MHERVVTGKHVTQHPCQRPSIQDQVVVAPDHLPGFGGQATDGQAQQGRLVEHEAAGPVRGQEYGRGGFLGCAVQVAPVVDVAGDLDTALNHLQRL